MICPEMDGGLPSPRPPAEQVRIFGENETDEEDEACRAGKEKYPVKVVNKKGQDVTEAFYRGARRSLEKAQAEAERLGEDIEGAILRANSPTCGSGMIYDGTFSKVLTEGDGIFAKMLKELGIPVEVTTAD